MQSTLSNIFQPSSYKRKQLTIGALMAISLIAFELFNFDTTQFALISLLGEVQFAGLKWASILAVAFCAIDFAGLARFFTPESNFSDEPREVWFLTGAWFLGATMNAIMTWWAISLTLLNHEFGNEVLSREDLLRIVPIFVAGLVWLTRILFIGGLAMMGDRLLRGGQPRPKKRTTEIRKAVTKPLPKIKSHGKKLPAKPRPYTPKTVAAPKPVPQPAAPAVSFLDDIEEDDIWEDEYQEEVVARNMPASRPQAPNPFSPSIAPPRASTPAPKPAPRPIQPRATYNKPNTVQPTPAPKPTVERRKMPARPNGGRPNMPPIHNRKN